MPIPKLSLDDNCLTFSMKSQSKSVVFSGTKVIRCKPYNHQFVLAKVLLIGFGTQKGQIFRQVLHPRFTYFPFYKNAFLFLFIFSALMLLSLIYVVIVMEEKEFSTWFIFIASISVLTSSLPPGVPAFMFANIYVTMARFRWMYKPMRIICNDKDRIIFGSKVTVMCFDKTGTLTESGIHIFGYVKAVDLSEIMLANQATVHEQANEDLFKVFATCHGAIKLNGQYIGDPLDISMV